MGMGPTLCACSTLAVLALIFLYCPYVPCAATPLQPLLAEVGQDKTPSQPQRWLRVIYVWGCCSLAKPC